MSINMSANFPIYALLVKSINWFTFVIYACITIRCLLSWFPRWRGNVFANLVYAITEPILGSIRNVLYRSPLGGAGMMLDFSPFIAYFLIEMMKSLLITLIGMLLL